MKNIIYNLISFSLCSLIIVLTDVYAKTSSLICNKNDVYLNDKFYFLKKKKYLLYDVNIGEGFNLQKEVLYRMSLVIYQLNKRDKEYIYYLVLPPWCYLSHWTNKRHDNLEWNIFLNIDIIKNVIPIIEFSDYKKLYGDVTDFIISFKYLLDSYGQKGKYYHVLPFDKCYIENYKFKIICENCDYKYSVTYSGNCTHIKGKNTLCYGDYIVTSYLVNFVVHKLFYIHNINSILIKNSSVVLVPFPTELFENNIEDILLFNERLIYNGNNYIKEILKNSNYISCHLRYSDFKKITSYDIPSVQLAIFKLLYIMFMNNKEKIFISTDEKKNVQYIINKHFKQFKHFFHFYENKDNYHEGQVAIIEQWICANSSIFVGNIFSRFTMHIIWERYLITKGNENQNLDLCGYSINNNEQLKNRYKKIQHIYDHHAIEKLNDIYNTYSEIDKKYIITLCFGFPSHLPNNLSIYRKKYIPFAE
ncbi:hypothetical protein YYC_02674 [Plasmodium yoelii 17X]|uniref:GDP-fucose protein O-fucosyltransferase 2 n=6 Tax=Plasmodium yoelii TaxID=5861 RepID=A0AAE9WMS3_PLAYO|nr:uncharacterized protein PY17X_0813700 [Plasmodium yoelii]EAA22665.1 Caenorhabditis elegans C21ORF80, putative [Plasmodium yoelii yoelii]ETB60378.1 hypothetical protein YYC_02674 [Plasmodium yoelii 17X]WBY56650.1 GDP-fucose protein O-fucosyltransferase 2 [Plasmodium yoelii yoelii]CDU17496.1 GDP-fucose protein O-fucosyltransferase 2, putative [Plasmodium yoelii]VTZ77268.1 GDP-fucose protein O-fucosyltransferase 2, putative [Plasmodium yoelii]|eukprot:XP_731100.1 uncharacterized protein PY17X_0813700 [Plasmodium yoelii]